MYIPSIPDERKARYYNSLCHKKKFSPGHPISFGKTLTPLLAGNKSVTRRIWAESNAQHHVNRFYKGLPCQAFDYSRRQGGKRIGWLEFTQKPYLEQLIDMPEEDIALEGFPEMGKLEFIRKFFKGKSHQTVWVIRFKFFSLTEGKIVQSA